MASVNKVILVGRLGRDPEIRYTQQGTAVAKFSIATSEYWTKDGQREEKTEWHRITVWGRQAENCNTYLSKGRLVYVDGRLQTSSWEDKNGVKRYTTEIIANTVQFLSSSTDKGGDSVSEPSDFDTFSRQPNSSDSTLSDQPRTSAETLDDVPF